MQNLLTVREKFRDTRIFLLKLVKVYVKSEYISQNVLDPIQNRVSAGSPLLEAAYLKALLLL